MGRFDDRMIAGATLPVAASRFSSTLSFNDKKESIGVERGDDVLTKLLDGLHKPLESRPLQINYVLMHIQFHDVQLRNYMTSRQQVSTSKVYAKNYHDHLRGRVRAGEARLWRVGFFSCFLSTINTLFSNATT